MKVWWLDSHPANDSVEFDEYEDYETLNDQFKQIGAVSESWRPVPVTFQDKGKPADFLKHVAGSLIISKKAKEILSQIPNFYVEFLPLNAEEQLYVMNVLMALDCVDPARSKEKRSIGKLEMKYMYRMKLSE